MSSTLPVANDGQSFNTHPQSRQSLNRSCESCRALKVRCLPDLSLPNQCIRCTKASRACIFVAPMRRRPRRRTDSRVAQLEKEMEAMRTILNDRGLNESVREISDEEKEQEEELDFNSNPMETSSSLLPDRLSGSVGHSHDGSSHFRSLANYPSLDSQSFRKSPSFSQQIASSPAWSEGGDVIDRSIISMETANQLISTYVNGLTEYFPAVILPARSTAAQMRQSKPVLFLSVLTAAAIAVDVNLANKLHSELLFLYAQRFFIKCEKSLEMVQALLIMAIYSLPPENPAQIQIYQYSHIAATMALEIGIASRLRVSRKASGKGSEKRQTDDFDAQMAEQARAILACYHCASSVGMRTRRPNMLLYNDWIKECACLLSRSPIKSDRWFATWFELQKITDQTLSSFGLDDTSSTAPLTESRVHTVLRWFDRRMEEWRDDQDDEICTVPMMLEYHYCILAVYELGVGEGYREPDAIKRQYYTLPAPDADSANQERSEPFSAIRVDITLKWMNAAHSLLDLFLSCNMETVQMMPNLVYSRVVSGILVLLKIHYSVSSGALGELVSTDKVNVESYIDSMALKLAEASEGSKYAIPARWLRVVGGKARDWYTRFQAHRAKRQAQSQKPHSNGSASQLTSGRSEPLVAPSWQDTTSPVPKQPSNQPSSNAYPPTYLMMPPGYGYDQGSSNHTTSYNMQSQGMETQWLACREAIYVSTNAPRYLPGTWETQPIQTSRQEPLMVEPRPGINNYPSMDPIGIPTDMEWDWIPDGPAFSLPSFG